VRGVDRPKTRLFAGLPPAQPGWVLVVDRPNRDLAVIETPQQRLTAGEVRFGQLRTVYEVDVREHPLEFEAVLPCLDDVGGFKAKVHYTCKVTDAAAVVRRGVDDVARTLVPLMTETLRRSCGEFAAEDAAEAEVAALGALRGLEGGEQRHDSAFAITSVQLELTLDAAAADHVARLKRTARSTQAEQKEAALEQQRIRLEKELAAARAEADEEKQRAAQAQAVAEAKAQHTLEAELERMRLQFAEERHRLELAAKRSELAMREEIELREIDLQGKRVEKEFQIRQVKITQIRTSLEGGEFAALAMLLEQDPQAIEGVVSYMAKERNAELDRQLEALKTMLANDALEGYQISEQAKTVLSRLVDAWSGRGWPLPGAMPSPVERKAVAASEETVTAEVVLETPVPAHLGAEEYPGDRDEPQRPGPAGAGPAQ